MEIKHNPARRYQFQIFLQSLLEESEKDFLNFGTRLIKSDNVRFNFKYVFFEILGSIQEPSQKILNYIAELIQETEYRILYKLSCFSCILWRNTT